MDQSAIKANTVPFLCPNNHNLGFITRGPDRIRRLHIITAQGIIIVSGEALIPCPICCQVRAWSPGVYSMRNILRSTSRHSKHS